MQVQGRSKQTVCTIAFYFIAYSHSHFFNQLLVPGLRKYGSYREGCAIVSFVITLTCRIDPESARTIREHYRRNTQTRNGIGLSCATWYKVSGILYLLGYVIAVPGSYANKQVYFLFQSHGSHHLVDR